MPHRQRVVQQWRWHLRSASFCRVIFALQPWFFGGFTSRSRCWILGIHRRLLRRNNWRDADAREFAKATMQRLVGNWQLANLEAAILPEDHPYIQKYYQELRAHDLARDDGHLFRRTKKARCDDSSSDEEPQGLGPRWMTRHFEATKQRWFGLGNELRALRSSFPGAIAATDRECEVLALANVSLPSSTASAVDCSQAEHRIRRQHMGMAQCITPRGRHLLTDRVRFMRGIENLPP